MQNQQNSLTRSNPVIRFSKPNAPNGWLSLHSPHGFTYAKETWNSAAQAWYSIVHSVKSVDFAKGHYKTRETSYNDTEKYGHLLGILRAKIANHPILKEYLTETEDSEIIHVVSKFSSLDLFWLGLDEDKGGLNKLGKAWMEIRDQLQKQKQCQTTTN